WRRGRQHRRGCAGAAARSRCGTAHERRDRGHGAGSGHPGGRQAERGAVDPRQLVVTDNAVPLVTTAPAGAGATLQAVPIGLVAWDQGPPAPITAAARGGNDGNGAVEPVAAPVLGGLSSTAGPGQAVGKEMTASGRPQPGERPPLPERRANGSVAVADGSEGAGGALTDEPGGGQREVQESKDAAILSPLLALLGVGWGAQGAEQQSRKPTR